MNSFIVSALFLIGTQSAFAGSDSVTDKVQMGRKLFVANCVVCHGDNGLGDGAAAIGLNPKPRNLVKDPFKNGTSKDKIYETLSKGFSGSAMPAFSQLTDADRLSLVFYVLSLRAP